MSVIQKGARVRLMPDQSLTLPYRKFADEGRLATVVYVYQPYDGTPRYIISFDVKRKGALPYTFQPDERDLIFVAAGDAP